MNHVQGKTEMLVVEFELRESCDAEEGRLKRDVVQGNIIQSVGEKSDNF